MEGRIREAVLRDEQKYDRIYMGILKAEWNKRSECAGKES